MTQKDPKKIRNIAIIAHIDHGKTTMLDSMLKQSNIFRENESVDERVMDSYDQEKERGITIFSKHTSIEFEGYKINLIDTPGHADFAGEVERVLGMVSSVLLLIDAQEGPMPQTRFVLSRALKAGLRPIVVVNKIDKPNADPAVALDKTLDLFIELGANDDQLDFPVCYASGRDGFAMRDLKDPRVDMRPIFEMIIEDVPPPPGNLDLPFLLQVATIGYDDFLGRSACGRILEGSVKKGMRIACVDKDGNHKNYTVTRIKGHQGLTEIEVDEAHVGDIASISGVPEVMIGDTLCDPEKIQQLPPIEIGKPTLSVEMGVNTSPFVGKDGKHLTIAKLRDRLDKEKKANISLEIEPVSGKEDWIRISGRGELHIAVLLEAMRREQFEFSISKPQVIMQEIDGAKHEPIEKVHIEVKETNSGPVIEELSNRKGSMLDIDTDENGITTLIYHVPTRGLLGFRNDFLTMTKGEGLLTSIFDHYGPHCGEIPSRKNGVMVSIETGKAAPYALFNLQPRGEMFVKATDAVYEGMIIGEHNRDNDLTVNPIKGKQLTNVRASGTDENVVLTPPRLITLETAINYIEDDELVEVTPNYIRLRKRFLTENERKRNRR